jgi:hypothetical protein
MRFFKGAWSFVRKIGEVDLRVVSYMFLGPNPPRIAYISPTIAIISLSVAFIRNPAGGAVLAAALVIGSLFVLYLISNAPPLRWHILSDDIRYQFSDPNDDRLEVTDTLNLRAMKTMCDSISYPLRELRGTLTVLEVSQDGRPLNAKAAGEAGVGYVVERVGQEQVRLVVQFRRVVQFGETTVLLVRWESRGGGAGTADNHSFAVNTFTDTLGITVCFHRLRYPREIRASSTFGIREEQLEFIPQRRAEGPDHDHVCETWRVPFPKYLRTYSLRWLW